MYSLIYKFEFFDEELRDCCHEERFQDALAHVTLLRTSLDEAELDPIRRACLWDNIEGVHYRLENYEEALTWAVRSLAQSQSVDLPRNFVAVKKYDCGCILRKLGRVSEAEQVFLESLGLFNGLDSEAQLQKPEVLSQLAAIEIGQGKYRSAEQRLVEAVRRRVRDWGWGQPILGTTFLGFSRLYFCWGKLLASERAARKALRILAGAGLSGNLQFILGTARLGEILAARGNHAGATQAYEQSLRSLREFHPDRQDLIEKGESFLQRFA